MLESILRASATALGCTPHRIWNELTSGYASLESRSATRNLPVAFGRVQTAIEAGLASGKLRAHPTFFEVMTAMAFVAFAKAGVDFVVYETGMGGRLDATNIVDPEVILITPIDFDHETFLGHSLEHIASEKAGIIKAGKTVVSSCERREARGVIVAKCAAVGARLVEIDSAFKIRQLDSDRGFFRAVISSRIPAIPTMISCCDCRSLGTSKFATEWRRQRRRKFSARNFRSMPNRSPGESPRCAGRDGWSVWEKPGDISGWDPQSSGCARAVAIREQNFAAQRIYLVYGSVRDKAVDEIAGLLFPRAHAVILTEPGSRAPFRWRCWRRSLRARATMRIVRDPVQALERALHMATPKDAVFVSGSLYLVGDIRAAAMQLARWRPSVFIA